MNYWGIATIALAVLVAIQAYFASFNAWHWRFETKNHLGAIRNSLRVLRSRCSEAIDLGEVLETPAAKHFARDIGWSILALEEDLESLLEENKLKFDGRERRPMISSSPPTAPKN